jgi:hypothetical protein
MPACHFTGTHTVSERLVLTFSADETRDRIKENVNPKKYLDVAGSDRRWSSLHDDFVICTLHKPLLG